MKYKAKFKQKIYDKYDKRYSTLVYEYRGCLYMVTVPETWNCSSDYLSGGYNSLKNQHQREQQIIDNKLDNPEPTYEKVSDNYYSNDIDYFFSDTYFEELYNE